MNEAPTDVPLCSTPSRRRADEWALVLTAEGFAPIVHRIDDRYAVCLAWHERDHADRARAALAAYDEENPPSRRIESSRPLVHPHWLEALSLPPSLVVPLALLAFFSITGPSRSSSTWFELGSADAARIQAGEWWRLVTALTLHSDLQHVMSNAVFGGVLFHWARRGFGIGLSALAVLAGGIAGNAVNAAIRTTPHDSVGASTAVFAALGLLCASAVALRGQRAGLGVRDIGAPFAAGVGLIAMMGIGGERTDLWAHVFGFLCGFGLGIPISLLAPRPPGPLAQSLLACAAIAAVVGSWCWALLR